jgi:general secretion pathway protein G
MRVSSGFTLIDLTLAITISGLLAAIALPTFTTYADRSQQTLAIAEIYEIQMVLEGYAANNFSPPDSLDEIGSVPRTDPWGSPYRYLRIEGNDAPGLRGMQRKDRNLNPLNSDFDLYSVGRDLESRQTLTARASRDDIVRASNGSFVGLAEDH